MVKIGKKISFLSIQHYVDLKVKPQINAASGNKHTYVRQDRTQYVLPGLDTSATSSSKNTTEERGGGGLN